MIEIKDASKVYRIGKNNQVMAIDHTSLTFPQKGMVAILGNSGSGKTTLLNMIGGLDKPNKGKIYVNGKLINGISSSKTDSIRNAEIGYIFQNYHLMDSMTVFENVALVLKMIGVTNKTEQTKMISYVLEKVGLYKYRNRPVDTLSGGERQRVGIARALVKNPSVIIADEPTGNLDSANSLKIMNIIKAISRDKLVIVVTHEKNLAHFYADRIVEVVDGKIVADYVNDHNDELDYRLDNKVYLKDFPIQQEASLPGMNINLTSDDSAKLNVRLVIKGGNLLIQCDGAKIDVVDSDSALELVDDHYKKITREESDESREYVLDYQAISHKKPIKYHHLFNPFTAMLTGLRSVGKFSVLKKILLFGFVIASGFVMFAYSSIFGISTITDDEFTSAHRSYVLVRTAGNTVNDLQKYSAMKGVNYVIPGDSDVSFSVDLSKTIYQFSQSSLSVSGSLASGKLLQKSALIAGRAPEKSGELVMDKLIAVRLAENYESVMLGMKDAESFLGANLLAGNEVYTVVGICDEATPCFYAYDSDMNTILRLTGSGQNKYYYMDMDKMTAVAEVQQVEDYAKDTYVIDDYDKGDYLKADSTVYDVEDYKDKITLASGSMPKNAYEVILPEALSIKYALDSKLEIKINDTQLKVVGFYSSKDESLWYTLAEETTVYYQWVASTANLSISCEDPATLARELQEQDINAQYVYEADYKNYEESVSNTISATVIAAVIIMIIGLLEIYLILRASFLSRIREVGTLRAIGAKKSDIYAMFIGEILVITILTSALGFYFAGGLVDILTELEFFGQMYTLDARVILLSIVTVFGFNLLAGLLPVWSTLRKTPAAILARTDVD